MFLTMLPQQHHFHEMMGMIANRGTLEYPVLVVPLLGDPIGSSNRKTGFYCVRCPFHFVPVFGVLTSGDVKKGAVVVT